MMQPSWLPIGFIFAGVLILFGFQKQTSQEGKENLKLQRTLENFRNDAAIEHAQWGFLAIDLKTGDTLASHDISQSLVPASSLKLLTTASALMELGMDHRFKTRLWATGPIEEGVLHGDLIIEGGGDPALASSYFSNHYPDPVFQDWTKKLKTMGVKKVTGAVIGDGATHFGNTHMTPRTWIWEDIGNYYGATPNGLSIHDNSFSITFSSPNAPEGATTIKSISPEIPGLKIQNMVISSRNPRDNAYVFSAPYSQTQYIKGTIPTGQNSFTIQASLPDPPFHAAHTFNNKLENSGISIKKKPTTYRKLTNQNLPDTTGKTLLATLKSPTTKEIVKITNMESMNLFAEHLFLEVSGKSSTEKAADKIRDLWAEWGMDTEGLFLKDGSGLSRYNGITPAQLTKVLQIMETSEFRKPFIASLPVAGKAGPMSYMLRGTKAAGILKAKSGYMERVRSYAGYTEGGNGHPIAFTFMVNNYTCSPSAMRRKMEKVMAALSE